MIDRSAVVHLYIAMSILCSLMRLLEPHLQRLDCVIRWHIVHGSADMHRA